MLGEAVAGIPALAVLKPRARHCGAQARGVIEVVMAHDHGRHLLAADERVGRVDARQRGGGAAAGLEHHQVIVELDHGAAVRADTHVPHAFAE